MKLILIIMFSLAADTQTISPGDALDEQHCDQYNFNQTCVTASKNCHWESKCSFSLQSALAYFDEEWIPNLNYDASLDRRLDDGFQIPPGMDTNYYGDHWRDLPYMFGWMRAEWSFIHWNGSKLPVCFRSPSQPCPIGCEFVEHCIEKEYSEETGSLQNTRACRSIDEICENCYGMQPDPCPPYGHQEDMCGVSLITRFRGPGWSDLTSYLQDREMNFIGQCAWGNRKCHYISTSSVCNAMENCVWDVPFKFGRNINGLTDGGCVPPGQCWPKYDPVFEDFMGECEKMEKKEEKGGSCGGLGCVALQVSCNFAQPSFLEFKACVSHQFPLCTASAKCFWAVEGSEEWRISYEGLSGTPTAAACRWATTCSVVLVIMYYIMS